MKKLVLVCMLLAGSAFASSEITCNVFDTQNVYGVAQIDLAQIYQNQQVLISGDTQLYFQSGSGKFFITIISKEGLQEIIIHNSMMQRMTTGEQVRYDFEPNDLTNDHVSIICGKLLK